MRSRCTLRAKIIEECSCCLIRLFLCLWQWSLWLWCKENSCGLLLLECCTLHRVTRSHTCLICSTCFKHRCSDWNTRCFSSLCTITAQAHFSVKSVANFLICLRLSWPWRLLLHKLVLNWPAEIIAQSIATFFIFVQLNRLRIITSKKLCSWWWELLCRWQRLLLPFDKLNRLFVFLKARVDLRSFFKSATIVKDRLITRAKQICSKVAASILSLHRIFTQLRMILFFLREAVDVAVIICILNDIIWVL